ncbi:MAG: hypothetical protein IIW54_01875, partial [Lachnospiraceae bacterium]|nr:hypothetical protein [Lachnospiraceae bacterium]
MRKYIIPLFAVFVSLLFLGGMEADAASGKDTIENNVFIGEVDVSGMTEQEAVSAVNEYVSSLKDSVITLNAMNNNQLSVSVGDFNISWSNEEV